MTAEVSFEDFVIDRSGALLRTAYVLTGDHHHAEDLLQTAFTAVYLRWGRIRNKGAAEAYLRRTLLTTYATWWRRRSWGERPVRELPVDPWRGSCAPSDHTEDRHDLWHQVQALPRQQRAVIVLRFYEDQSVEDTAAILGLSVGTVKSYTSRALAALRVLHSDDPAESSCPPRELAPHGLRSTTVSAGTRPGSDRAGHGGRERELPVLAGRAGGTRTAVGPARYVAGTRARTRPVARPAGPVAPLAACAV